MARNPKKITVDTAAWVAEYLVSRVNRADYKLKMHDPEKREQGNGNHPKAEVYRMAATAIDLQSAPAYRQEQAWLKALTELLEGLNDWVDAYLSTEDRSRLWGAYRVAKHHGLDGFDLILAETYQQVLAENQLALELG